jgi:hypothetical protein
MHSGTTPRPTNHTLLRELIAYEEFANMNKTDSDDTFGVKKE